MAIPGFQDFMLPLMQFVAGRESATTSEYYAALANHFALSEEDQQVTLASGPTPVYKNRIGWAVTHLVKAGLLERPTRGAVRITERGRSILSENPERIDLHLLNRFEDHRAFRARSTTDESAEGPEPDAAASEHVALSPDEQLFQSYRELRRSLAQDLLDRIKSAPPAFFEQLVVDLLVAMGYGGSHEDAGQAVGKSGDGGIDGIIKEDRLGLDFVYIQAKRWENVIGRPQVQGFAGSLEGQRARKGVFITTSSFTDNAREYVKLIEKRIVLIDGIELANLMLDYGIGVTDVATYKVQRIDPAYFGEE